MATVHINERVRQHVKSKITERFQPQIEAERAKFDNLDIARHAFEQITTPEIRNAIVLLQNCKAPWLNRVTQVPIQIAVAGNNRTRIVSVPAGSDLVFPCNGPYHASVVTITPTNPVHASMTAIYTRIVEIEKEHDELVEALINGILAKCTTLKQVLEIWPSAMDFMPEDVVKRHSKPNPKRTKTGVIKQDAVVEDTTVVALTKLRLMNP